MSARPCRPGAVCRESNQKEWNLMRRTTLSVGLLGLLAWAWAASPAEQPKPDNPMPKAQAKADDSPAGKLARRVDFRGIDDPKATLDEALRILASRYELNFDVNEAAFKLDQVSDPLKVEIATPTPISEMKNVTLETALRKILARVPSASGAVLMVRRDLVEITTGEAQRLEVWGQGYTGPRLPLVHVSLNKRPLDEALNHLAEQSQFNVVLDRRAGEKATTTVTARFRNVPLDTAVRLLAEMADLRSVHLDNVLFVTTKAHAASLEKQLEKENPFSKQRDVPGGKGGKLGLGGLGGAFSPETPVFFWRKGPGHSQGVHPEGAGER
jgi:hypothetical protein